MWWCRILLALFLFQTISALDPCAKCQCGETSQEPKEETLSFNEGQNVTVIVEGDFGSEGCKFLFHQDVGNVTCCYIDIRRHHNNQGEALCGRLTEPASCRKKDTYYVREIDGYNGWCSMTLFDGKRSDSGEYQVLFPADPESNAKRIVEVNKDGLYSWEIILICLPIVVFILLAIVFYKYKGRTWLEKREVAQRKRDTKIINLLRNNKTDDFKTELGTRSILGIRDKKHNTVFHLAARTDWTDDMTKTILEIVTEREGPESIDEESGSFLFKKEDIFHRLEVTYWSKWIPDSFPGYLIPDIMLHLTINLNSRNKEGNTPLIIASKYDEENYPKEIVDMLVTTKMVNINIQNAKNYTALHEAVLKKNATLVDFFINKGATHKTSLLENGHTPLHTAVDQSSLEIVELLVTNLENKERTWANQIKRGIKGIETPLYLAFKRSHDKHENIAKLDIANYLIEKGYGIAHDEDKNSTIYELAAGGKQSEINLLIKKGNLKWKDCKDVCLLEAVERNHPKAVYNLFSDIINGPKPSDKPDPTRALEKAKMKLSKMIETESKEKMNKIIKRLNTEVERNGEDISEHKKEEEDKSRQDEHEKRKNENIMEKKEKIFKHVSELNHQKIDWSMYKTNLMEFLKDLDEPGEELYQSKDDLNTSMLVPMAALSPSPLS
eukprot:GFUD01135978.1.p1 GENE.GFUD01135978.1~~GFUD01135978.1.p1  ORF type:complete len:689 (-),score=135.46 GFUD01135978.1:17-2017(-)